MTASIITQELTYDRSLRVLTAESLSVLLQRLGFAEIDFDQLLDEMVEAGILRPVSDTVYLNTLQTNVTALEALPHLFTKARLSLASRLAQTGVLNNPSHALTVTYSDDSNPDIYRVQASQWDDQGIEVIAYPLPDDIYEAGTTDDRLDPSFGIETATAEQAIVEWAWLARSEIGLLSSMLPTDCDLSALDVERLSRLAGAVGVEQEITEWLEACKRYRKDGDVDANMSRRLGF